MDYSDIPRRWIIDVVVYALIGVLCVAAAARFEERDVTRWALFALALGAVSAAVGPLGFAASPVVVVIGGFVGLFVARCRDGDRGGRIIR